MFFANCLKGTDAQFKRLHQIWAVNIGMKSADFKFGYDLEKHTLCISRFGGVINN